VVMGLFAEQLHCDQECPPLRGRQHELAERKRAEERCAKGAFSDQIFASIQDAVLS